MDHKKIATSIVQRLTDKGFKAYFAGGWVRDFLMGHPSSDIDIATDATTEQIMSIFPHTIPVGIAFGVVIVVEDGVHFEVATFRRDVNYLNGRSPERIELATAQEDASRRDFTVNGMFYDPLQDMIIDYVGGKEDLKKKVLRTIGDPNERFEEDRLRMIRAVRFSSRFEFHIDLNTRNAIETHARTLFPAVAIERIWQELVKMREYPRLDYAIIEMARLGLLQVIFPALAHTPLDDIQKRVRNFHRFPEDCPMILFLLKLFPDSSLQEWTELGYYLKIRKSDIVLIDFYWKAEQLLKKDEASIELAEWAYFYANVNSKICLEIILSDLDEIKMTHLLHQHAHRKHLLTADIHRIVHKTPLVTSTELQAQGIPSGKLMGQLLKESERIAINLRLHHSEDVLRELKRLSLWPTKPSSQSM